MIMILSKKFEPGLTHGFSCTCSSCTAQQCCCNVTCVRTGPCCSFAQGTSKVFKLTARRLQDWAYVQGQCMELTVEVSQDKWPAVELLPGLFEANLPALLAFPLAAAFSGLR